MCSIAFSSSSGLVQSMRKLRGCSRDSISRSHLRKHLTSCSKSDQTKITSGLKFAKSKKSFVPAISQQSIVHGRRWSSSSRAQNSSPPQSVNPRACLPDASRLRARNLIEFTCGNVLLIRRWLRYRCHYLLDQFPLSVQMIDSPCHFVF